MLGEIATVGQKFFFIRTLLGKDVFALRAQVRDGAELYVGATVDFGLAANPRRPNEEMAIDIRVRKFEGFCRGLPPDASWAELMEAVEVGLGSKARRITLRADRGLAWFQFPDHASLALAMDGAVHFRGAPLRIVLCRSRDDGAEYAPSLAA